MSQTFANHRRYVPGFHFVLGALIFVNLLAALWALWQDRSGASVFHLSMVLVTALLFWYARGFPLKVQDRLIRLEERLRLQELLPEATRGRIGELTVDQLIGLRFASDGEVAGLVERVLAGELSGCDEIKRAVQSWRPDELRA